MRKCRIITGARDAGKTRMVMSMHLTQGIVTLCESADKNVRYLMDLSDGAVHDCMRRGERGYIVSEGAFEWAAERLSRIEKGNAAVDECGMIELRDRSGFHDSIAALMEKEEVNLYVTVRDSFLPLFLSEFSPDEYEVITT